MDSFKNFFKNVDNKKMANLTAAFVIGITLIILSNTLLKKPKESSDFVSTTSTQEKIYSNTMEGKYEKELENRLENTLSLIEGVGEVKVLLRLTYSNEIVISQDTVTDESITKETDDSGGIREITNKKIDTKNILINENGKQKPLILKEYEPKIEGVIVIAEGGKDAEIKNELIKSVQTVLAIDSHKIQILKMK